MTAPTTSTSTSTSKPAATSATSMGAVPVVIDARHVRLSAGHVELLFGPRHTLLELAPLAHTGRFAAADVVDVRGPAATLKNVRVLGPVADVTRVYLSDDDLAEAGLGASEQCSLDGPRGTLVLAPGGVRFIRRLVVSAPTAAAIGKTADVMVRAERARELRGITVEGALEGPSEWVAVDVADANAMDVGPSTRATLSSQSS